MSHVGLGVARFRVVRWREGYDIADVDAFLAQVAARMMTSEDVESARFKPTRMRAGYDMREVDDYLDIMTHKQVVPAGGSISNRTPARRFLRLRPWTSKNRNVNLIGNAVLALVVMGMFGYDYSDGTARTAHATGQVVDSPDCEVVFTTADRQRVDWTAPNHRRYGGNSSCADPVGASVTIWFDPKDPQNASLQATSDLGEDLWVGGATAALIVGYSAIRWKLAERKA